MNGTIALRRTTLLLPAVLFISSAAGQQPARSELPRWVDEVQTYGMLPLLPQRAAELRVSVNGVWAGIGTDNPILPAAASVASVRSRFGTDAAAFVKACHEAGLIVPAVVNGLEGFPALRAQWPKLEEMACRDRDGKPVNVGEFILMCTNNPDWIQWEIQFGKRGLDIGADLVLVDTPMASAFVSGGMLKAGFCTCCMANFRKHLETRIEAKALREKLGIDRFDDRRIIERLSARQTTDGQQQPFLRTGPDDLLFREFIACQEQASFDTRKRLIDSLRQYARAQGRKVAFTTNAADLGTQNAFGHWVRGIMFADLVDLFIYEQDQLVEGMPSNDAAKLPRGKWAAYHKLAHSIHRRRSAAVLHASAMGTVLKTVLQGKTTNAWLGTQCAEAYAANGAYVLFQIEPSGLKMFANKCWAKAAEVTGFVQAHKDLYEGSLRSGSALAMLFLLNERGRTIPGVFPSFLGIAQGLIEGNFPFDVLFGGDGRYVNDRLTAADLRRYRSVIVPSPIAPTENQKVVLRAFVAAGGTLVCQEPEALGLAGSEKIALTGAAEYLEGEFAFGGGRVIKLVGSMSSTRSNDVGSAFFKTHHAKFRKQIAGLAERLELATLVDPQADGLVCAFPILQTDKERVVVHVVNYDVDYDRDAVREKTRIRIRMPLRPRATRDIKATLYAPGAVGPKPLEVTASGDVVSCVIDRLAICASVVFSPAASGP
jgi:hypothetical protein